MSTLTANAEPEIGSEDHPLERVPDDERVNWLGPHCSASERWPPSASS